MLSKEALVGTRVRVRDSLLRADLRGLEGTITGRWGHPEYVALDVLLGEPVRHRFAGAQRDLVLRGAPAAEDRDPHSASGDGCGACFPTTIVTSVPGSTSCPGGGN